jgi:hypothetical protein
MQKIYFKPPKVKTKRRNTNQPLPEWNSTINDLNKYKLTSSEIVSKLTNIIFIIAKKKDKFCFKKFGNSKKRFARGSYDYNNIINY